MTRQFIPPQQSSARNAPQGGVARFSSEVPRGTSVMPLRQISFAPERAYMEEMNAIADVGEGVFNATLKLQQVSKQSDKQAKDAYLANVESQDIVETNRIYNENALQGNDPQALAQKLQQYRDGKKDLMPEEIKPYYQQSFDKRAATLTVKSQDQFFKKAQDDSKASLEASQKIIRDDIFSNPLPSTEVDAQLYEDKITKFRAVVQSRVDNGFITPEDAILEQKGFQKDLITTGYKAQLERLSPTARAKTIYALQNSKSLPNGITIEDKQDIVNQLNAYSDSLDATKKRAFAEESAAAALQKARQVADLEIRVSRGEADYEDVVKAEQSRLITPDKKASLFKSLDGETEKRLKQSEAIQKVARALDGKDYIDPKDSDDKKAVDLAYTQAVEPRLAENQDPAAQKTLITNFVSATGVVPDSLRGRIRGVFRGGNINDKVYYADLVGRIQETKPQALDDFDDKDVTQAVMIDQMVKAGTPNEEAVKRVEDITNNINPGRIEFLKTQFEEVKKSEGATITERNDKTLKRVRNLFDEGVFSRDATLPNQQLGVEVNAINDYDRIYKTWYLNTNGDADLAKKQADRVFKSSWGTTSVNGQDKQLTKYPIEKAYPLADPQELKGALLADVKALPEYKDIDEDKVFLQYDARTAREYGSQPSYRVLVLNKDGVIEPVADPKLSRWAPDYRKMVEDKRVKSQMDAEIMRKQAAKQGPVSRALGVTPDAPEKPDRSLKKDLKTLGDKIFSVFISDAGAAEPTPAMLQQFAAKQNLSESQIRASMEAQNRQKNGFYTAKELKVLPPLLKGRYHRTPDRGVTLENAAQFDDLSEQEVRDLMLQQNHTGIGTYSSKDIAELPVQIVQRYYRGGEK